MQRKDKSISIPQGTYTISVFPEPPSSSNSQSQTNQNQTQKQITSKIEDLPMNLLFRRHDGEWLALDVHKNQIDNFLNVYEINQPKPLREVIRNVIKKKLQRGEKLINSTESLQVESVTNFEVNSGVEKANEPHLLNVHRTLGLLE